MEYWSHGKGSRVFLCLSPVHNVLDPNEKSHSTVGHAMRLLGSRTILDPPSVNAACVAGSWVSCSFIIVALGDIYDQVSVFCGHNAVPPSS